MGVSAEMTYKKRPNRYYNPEKLKVGDLVSDGFDTYGMVTELDPEHDSRLHKTTRYCVVWINSINYIQQWCFGVDLELESRA